MSNMKDKEKTIADLLSKVKKINDKYSSAFDKPKVKAPPPGFDGLLETGIKGRNQEGEYFYIEKRIPFLDLPYLRSSKTLFNPDPKWNSLLHNEDISPEKWVAFDIETSGLGFDQDIFAFLMGFCSMDKNGLTIREYFIEDPSKQRAALYEAAQYFKKFDLILSFNGRGFDLPVMENMYNREKMSSPFSDILHTDLLIPARRFWRHYESRSLQSLEKRLLSFHRTGDIPSSLIPEKYYEYLYTGRTDDIEQIIWHNLWDVASLFSIAAAMNRMLDDIDSCDSNELLNLCEYFMENDEDEIAGNAFERLKERGIGNCSFAGVERFALKIRNSAFSEAGLYLLEELILNEAISPKGLSGYLVSAWRKCHYTKKVIDLIAELDLGSADRKRFEKLVKRKEAGG